MKEPTNLPPPQLTGTIKRKTSGKNEQVLDKLKVERERGITGSLNLSNIENSYICFFSQGSDGKVSQTTNFNATNLLTKY
jgi:hypothetical protein